MTAGSVTRQPGPAPNAGTTDKYLTTRTVKIVRLKYWHLLWLLLLGGWATAIIFAGIVLGLAFKIHMWERP